MNYTLINITFCSLKITKALRGQSGKIFLFPLILMLACGGDKEKEKNSSNPTSQLESRAIVPLDSTVLIPQKGLVFYRNQPFTGRAVSKYPNGTKSNAIDYLDGKKHGFYRKWFDNGTLSYEADYQIGRQNGVSKTWWRNGNLRSESKYVDGVPHGEQWQWYKSGAKFKKQNLVNGQEEGIQQAWRENGKIYNNYEAKNGRIFGLKRSTLCYELDDENLKLNN